MSYTIKTDAKTGREYYQLNSGTIGQELADKVDFNNLVIAFFQGDTRFLLKDATLVMAGTGDYKAVYNSLMSYAPGNITAAADELENNIFTVSLADGEGHLTLECTSCDNEKPHNYEYEFGPGGAIYKRAAENFIPTPPQIDMDFHLTSHQANNVFNSISSIYEAHNQGLYKFIKIWQMCTSLPVNTYRNSGLPHHVSYFYTDSELLREVPFAFKDRFYHPHDLTDPNRSTVSKFMKEVFGPNFANRWNLDGEEDISDIKIDLEKAMANPEIKARIEGLKELRSEVYRGLVELWNTDNKITAEHIKPFVERDFTNAELYYTYIIKHELEQHKVLLQLPYVNNLEIIPFGIDIAISCTKGDNPLYAPLCQAVCDKLMNFTTMNEEREYLCNKWQEDGICQVEYEYTYGVINENEYE